MIDWNAPLQLRDGRPARLLGEMKSEYSHVCVATNNDGTEWAFSVNAAGRFLCDDGAVGYDHCDVINAPKKVWLNIYQLSNGSYSACDHTSRAAAESAVDKTNRLVACIEVSL